MSEFGDIFSEQLTTTVFLYGSLVFLAICAMAATWMTARPSEKSFSSSWRPAA
jgi:hypothetical protein